MIHTKERTQLYLNSSNDQASDEVWNTDERDQGYVGTRLEFMGDVQEMMTRRALSCPLRR